MAGVAGYTTRVLISGSGVAMTSQALSTFSTAANTYQITSTARRVWDRTASLSFFENSGTTAVSSIASADISSINRLFGIVTFASTKSGTVSVSGTYLPLAVAAGAKSHSVSVSRVLLDNTDFTSTGWMSRVVGLFDATVSISRWDSISTSFFSLLKSGADCVIEVNPGASSTNSFRMYAKVSNEDRGADVASLEESNVTFELNGTTNGSLAFNSP